MSAGTVVFPLCSLLLPRECAETAAPPCSCLLPPPPPETNQDTQCLYSKCSFCRLRLPTGVDHMQLESLVSDLSVSRLSLPCVTHQSTSRQSPRSSASLTQDGVAAHREGLRPLRVFRHLANASKVGKYRGRRRLLLRQELRAPLIPAPRRVKEMEHLGLHTCSARVSPSTQAHVHTHRHMHITHICTPQAHTVYITETYHIHTLHTHTHTQSLANKSEYCSRARGELNKVKTK